VLSSEEAAELDRRVAEHAEDPEVAVPWSEIKVQILSKLGR
jgi:putative addiction module component (TIGR02574 family)